MIKIEILIKDKQMKKELDIDYEEKQFLGTTKREEVISEYIEKCLKHLPDEF